MDKILTRMIWAGAWLVFFMIAFIYLIAIENYEAGTVIFGILMVCTIGEILLYKEFQKEDDEEEVLLIDRGMN